MNFVLELKIGFSNHAWNEDVLKVCGEVLEGNFVRTLLVDVFRSIVIHFRVVYITEATCATSIAAVGWTRWWANPDD